MALDHHDDSEFIKALDAFETKLKTKFSAINDRITGIEQKGIGGGTLSPGMGRKSLGDAVLGADGFGDFASRRVKRLFVDTQTPILAKSTILGEGGSPQQPDNNLAPYQTAAGIVGGAFRPLTFLDLVPRAPAASNSIHFVREAALVNRAAETAEGASKPETDVSFEGIDAPVRTFAHWLRASVQILDDQPALAGYLDRRLRHGVLNRIERQMLQGDGIGSNLSGMNQTGNHTDLSVVTGDSDFDAAARARSQVIQADYVPTAYVVHPADWLRLTITKTGVSGDGRYLAGEPSSGFIRDGLAPALWGLPVVVSNNCPAGSFFCLAGDALQWWERAGVVVEMFAEDANNVTQNLVTIRAEARGAFAVLTPAAVIFGAWPGA